MQFEWNAGKHARNLELRGLGFDDGALIFEGSVIEWTDARRDYGEVRVRAVGQSEGDLLHVVYTERDDIRRIISVRLANRRERAAWQRQYG